RAIAGMPPVQPPGATGADGIVTGVASVPPPPTGATLGTTTGPGATTIGRLTRPKTTPVAQPSRSPRTSPPVAITDALDIGTPMIRCVPHPGHRRVPIARGREQ